ncbi:hypothetical protein HDV03_005016 [Kappamyces sp. JEL0829]|nr:hypothetical protein HDV03_005016 [Kappamyces sp. JEL0829]
MRRLDQAQRYRTSHSAEHADRAVASEGGPVRACSFHPVQPLFVSGGDDYKIKVWNWKLGKSLFTLSGHLDYIRHVSFHNEAPWIVSGGDDQTLRIWNWQSRTCISVLTGHSHYTMSCFFHPTQDLLLSASLDQTVRVWDISGLRKKHAAGQQPSHDDRFGGSSGGPGIPGNNPDVFGNMDCVVKYVLEGHSRGVNWASFHPTLPLIISCGDDRLIKLWRMNDSKAWEVDTCRGHFNNISAVFFHAPQDVIVSAAEDKTIRVWDMAKRTCISTFRREHDRFWSLATHPTMNLFAAGHDTGLIVFKLERERPAYDIHGDICFYVSGKSIHAYNFAQASDMPLINIKRGQPGQAPPPKILSFNPAENAVMLSTGKDDGPFEIYALPRKPTGQLVDAEPRRGVAAAAIFVARNRFAVIEKGKILIKDMNNATTKEFFAASLDGKNIKASEIFYAGGKNILAATATSVVLFDTEARSAVGECAISNVRYVSWNHDQTCIALISKHNIAIANSKLEQITSLHETIKIKSAAWDPLGVLIYSTLNHIKYCLKNGDTGIIKTIEEPVYVVRVKNNIIHVLTRQGKMAAVSFDPTEYRFKLALINRNYDEVFHLIKTSNLMGQSIIGYLQKKGYPEIALQFVKDPKTRFDLAIECGNIDAALEMAKAIDKEQYWTKLGTEALRQGNQMVVEFVYQKTKNFDKLSFLYLVVGNNDKLKKMLKIAEARNDSMSRFQNATYVGDIADQVKIYRESGQLSLAYLAAQTHGLYDVAAEILQEAGLDEAPPILPNAVLLRAPHPALKQANLNWPQLSLSKNVFEGQNVAEAPSALSAAAPSLDAPLEDVGDWGDEDLDDLGEVVPTKSAHQNGPAKVEPAASVEDGAGWDLDDDLDIGSVASPVKESGAKIPAVFTPPKQGTPPGLAWVKNSNLAADHIAAGSFETAMQLLHRQIGASNFSPLKPYFMAIFQSTRSFLPGTASTQAIVAPILRHWGSEDRHSRPAILFTSAILIEKLQQAYPVMTQGRFNEAVTLFRSILHQATVTVAASTQEAHDITQLIVVCREYLLGLAMETTRKELGNDQDPKRAIELAAYFTHCQLQTVHLQLAIRLAMVQAFKMRNFGTARGFAQRLLEQGPSPQVAASANKILQHCERVSSNAIELDYDQYNPFVICAASFCPIYQGSPSVGCPFCQASFRPEYQDTLCTICQISKVGASANGQVLLGE